VLKQISADGLFYRDRPQDTKKFYLRWIQVHNDSLLLLGALEQEQHGACRYHFEPASYSFVRILKNFVLL
jgi:hypothetical protein